MVLSSPVPLPIKLVLFEELSYILIFTVLKLEDFNSVDSFSFLPICSFVADSAVPVEPVARANPLNEPLPPASPLSPDFVSLSYLIQPLPQYTLA